MTSARRTGAVLLAAAVAVGAIGYTIDAGYANIAGFFLMPLLSGLGFLTAAAVSGRGGSLWPTALTTSLWGLLIQLNFAGLVPVGDGTPGDPVSIGVYVASAVVAGLVAYLLIRWLGLRGTATAVAVVVAVSLAIYGAALGGVPGVVGWWLYPVLMVAMAVALVVRPRERVAG
ncbi:MAG: hypothetical protein ACT4RN_04385 [Pseudonocardia sp.]